MLGNVLGFPISAFLSYFELKCNLMSCFIRVYFLLWGWCDDACWPAERQCLSVGVSYINIIAVTLGQGLSWAPGRMLLAELHPVETGQVAPAAK